MKVIDFRSQKNIEFRLYPDNQPHVKVTGIEAGDTVKVVAPLKSSLNLMNLLMCVSALRHLGAEPSELSIPYLLGARSDRVMEPGDSFDLQVVANLINGCQFSRVNLYDVHSPVALDLIHNSTNVPSDSLIAAYQIPDAVLISPDKGAASKVDDLLNRNPNLKDVVQCEKSRDLSNGHITLKVMEPEKCRGRNCVIFDDICDGGGTFLAIASQIEAAHLTLAVTHGIFSKGFHDLEKHFQSILVTDSYYGWSDFHSPILKCIPIDP